MIFQLKSDNFFLHGIHRSLEFHLDTNQNPIYHYVFSFEGDMNFFRKFSTTKALPIHFLCIFLLNNVNREGIRSVLSKISNSPGYGKITGACHADELGYQFRTFFSPKIVEGSKEAQTVKRMINMWTNFAKCGNPTPEGNNLGVAWTPANRDEHIYLDIGEELVMKKDPFDKRNKFWDEIFAEHCSNQS